jgi:hypothetical protein
MKIRIKNRISNSEADKLIERYYDGLTSVEEEKQLLIFLSQSNLPDHYKPEQAIFGYFDGKKKKVQFSLRPYIRWASVAALILASVFISKQYMVEKNTDYAFVDGKKITNISEIKSQALASLSDISAKNNEVEDGLKNMNNDELIKKQLDVFSGY